VTTHVAARIGVLGGTFDPIHVGHLAAASEVQGVLSLDKVVVVPTATQPFKSGMDVAPAHHRVAMARLATAPDPRFVVSTVDVDRGAPTFTVDTINDLREGDPEASWYFITGADALARVGEWKDAERLWNLATFVGVTRPGYAIGSLDPRVRLVEVPGLAVSSTDIRRRVRAGEPFRYLVPDAVADYIVEHYLYRGGLHGR
jgi:nicotinate-nucleotide adenylyltransferase